MIKNREKELAKNTFIISLGKISTQLITFLLLPLYTAVLSTQEYGIVDLLNTLVLLLLPIVSLQIEQSIFRELIEFRTNDEKKKTIISNGLIIVFFQVFLYILIFLAISIFIKNEYKYYLMLNLIAYVFSNVFLQTARGLGDNKRYSLGSCISAGSTIIFNILFLVIIKLGAKGMLLGTMLGQLLCTAYLFIFLRLYKYVSLKRFEKKVIKKLLKYSIPLIPNAISWWIFNTSDRIIVSLLLGLSFNGILSVASKFSVIFVGIYNIFNMSWTESISLHINDKDFEDFFKNMFDTIIRLFTAFSFLMISFMPIIFRILINKNYIYGYNLVPLLLIASLFNVVVGLISVIYIAKKDSKSLAITSVFSAIINIVSHIILIKSTGLYAAAISTLISYLCLIIYRLLDIRKKYFNIKFNKKYLISSLVIMFIIISLYYVKNIYVQIISMFISVVYALVLNKNMLKNIKSIIFGKFKIEKNN